jgi:MFS family permease
MKKLFHGWRIVVAGSTMQFLQSMLLNQAFGVYVAALVEDKGWSKTSVAGAAALKSTEVAALGPVLGWAIDRFGAQGIIRAGVVLFGAGFMLLSWIDTLVGFYAAFLVIALGSSMFSNFVIGVTVIHWFEKKRARALSALQFGIAFGGLFVFLVALSVQTYGWRVTAFGSGILAILAGWPLTRVMRSRPADIGETVDGEPPAPRVSGEPEAPAGPAFTARQAMRTSAFWLISLGHAFSLLVVSSITVHAVTHIKEGLGYTLAQASLVLALITAGQFIGLGLGWVIGDKIEKRVVAAACLFMHAVALLMLTYAAGVIILVLSALVHGAAWGLRGPYMQAIRADYFGRRSIGVILGLSSLITVFGQIGGPLIAGAFADWTGNYRTGFTVLAVLAALGSLFFLMAKPPQPPSIATT